MQQPSFAYSSNQLMKLLEALVKNISSDREEGSLLSFRCIVPSLSLKGWLTIKLEEAGIAPLAGEILVLEEALAFFCCSRRALLPSLVSFLKRYETNEWGVFGEEGRPEDRERLFSIAKRHILPFARLFFLDEESWFCEKNCTSMGEAFLQFMRRKKSPFPRSPSYLFGFSSLHEGALTRLLSTFDVRRMFLLSPSMLFWGDQSSDAELRMLLKKNPSPRFEEALLPFIHERQRLLANAGVIGREFFNLLEDLDLPVTELYEAPLAVCSCPPYNDYVEGEGLETTSRAPKLIDFVKADLLLLVGARETPQVLAKDDSIEIHPASTPLREVEALQEYLWMVYGEKVIQPCSIIVLVTDVRRYRAPFEQVFGGARSLYQSWDGFNENDPVTFLYSLFNFLQSQGGVKDFLPLVKNFLFLEAFEVARDERDELVSLLEKLDFSSLNDSVRERYLEKRGIHPQHTTKTLSSLYKKEVGKLFGEESCIMKSSHLAFIAKVRSWLSRVEEVVQAPIDLHVYQEMSTWVELFNRLFEPFIAEDGAFFPVIKALSTIKCYPGDASLPFYEISSILFAELREVLHASPRALQAPIILGELGSFQPFPAEVIAILGAEEGSLPKENEDPLKYLDRLPPTLYPSSKLFERYAFIEALLSAERLFIGYQSYAFDLREHIAPSATISDLLAHLDSNYLLSGEKPSKALVRETPLHKKRPKTPFLAQPVALHGKRKGSSVIQLNDIQKTAKNPLVTYLKTQFGSVQEWEENESIFIKPYEIKQHLEEQLLGKAIISQREHSLALQAYEEAKKRVEEVLQEMNLGSFSPLTVDFLPTVREPKRVGETLLCPQFESRGYSVQGSWNGIIRPGIILFSETWKYELVQRRFECVLRSALSQTHGLDLEDSFIIIKEKRVEPFSIKDPLGDFHQWVAFSQLACNFPFPFSYEVVKLLLKKPSLDELEAKVCAETASLKLEREEIENYKGMWEEWASILFGELLVREEQT